ncbi:MAG: hypothetical protein IPP37_14200 [Saprospiraceae bacterium]|nr:hypothetical protein [Saprospiraceae bacterium]
MENFLDFEKEIYNFWKEQESSSAHGFSGNIIFVVTGATSGFGAAIAATLLEEGASCYYQCPQTGGT